MPRFIAAASRLLIVLAAIFAIPLPASAQESAAVGGIVFEDINGNGLQDEGESGIPNVVIIASHADDSASFTTVTDADGAYRLEAARIQHRIYVDESSLPIIGVLTTGQASYGLTILSGYTALGADFGYRPVFDPAAVTGTVFQDSNGDGVQDSDEPGLAGVQVSATHNETGAVITATTQADGSYTLESGTINHRVTVDASSLPFTGQITTGHESYDLDVQHNVIVSDTDFGFQEVAPTTVTGTVFQDYNEDGVRQPDEPGIGGVQIIAEHNETGAVITATTQADGSYTLEAAAINHRFSVDTATLPFLAELTTGRESYILDVRPTATVARVDFGYREVAPAAVTGFVFQDNNGDGVQDADEPGLADVQIIATHNITGAVITTTTQTDGAYFLEAATLNHRLTVDTATLPFTAAQLTTGHESYDLEAQPSYTILNTHFGYQEVELTSAAAGVVFEDVNGNGQQDAGENGLPGVTLIATPRDSNKTLTLVTAADGSYRYDNPMQYFSLRVDENTVPLVNAIPTSRTAYRLNIPLGYIVSDLDFGFQSAVMAEMPSMEPQPDTEAPAPSEPDAPDPGSEPTEENQVYDDGTIRFVYPAGWVARPAVMSDVPGIAVATSEAAIATLEAGDFAVAPGEIVITIQTLAAIAQNNAFDIVADAGSAASAPQMYARELAESGYATAGPDTLSLGDKTVTRAGAVIFGFDQIIYGWDAYVIYATSAAGEMEGFQPAVEGIIASIQLGE